MIDSAEVERCRRKWLGLGVLLLVVGLLVHPLLLLAGLCAWLWMVVLWLGMRDGGLPRRLERWSAGSERNLGITIVLAHAFTGFFVSGYVLFAGYFTLRLIVPAGWLP